MSGRIETFELHRVADFDNVTGADAATGRTVRAWRSPDDDTFESALLGWLDEVLSLLDPEPEAKHIIDGLMFRFIESQVYQGLVENIASEMSARMVAMKSATDNAGELMDELQLIYNKAFPRNE